MSQPEEQKGIIGVGMAFALFALLAAWSLYSLRGVALAFALIVIGGLAIKAYVHFLRSRIE